MPKQSHSYRRHRNPPRTDPKSSQEPFFSQAKDSAFFQPKLTVGQPGDPYEREADRVADAVVHNTPTTTAALPSGGISPVQRTSLATPQEDEKQSTADARMEQDKLIQEKSLGQESEEETLQMQPEEEEPVQMMESEEEEVLQSKATAGAPGPAPLATQLSARRGKGHALPAQARQQMERGIGADFSGVRIHTDQEAATMNQQLGARAFTSGQDVYFNKGQYRPDSAQGKHLLAHELTHVVQQGASKAGPNLQQQPAANPTLTARRFNHYPELEAARAGTRFVRSGARGDHVAALQKALIDEGFTLPRFGVDGIFGVETKNAVAAYQDRYHLRRDGIVGPETMGHLDTNFATTVVTDRYTRWYDQQIRQYHDEASFPYHVAVMNVFYKRRNFHVVQILNDIQYDVYTFSGATDRWRYHDGRTEETDLSNSLRGNTDRGSKIIRLNAALTPLRAAMTLYHEMNHVTSREPDYLQQEIESRVVTEQFAIDNQLPPTKPEYRTSDGRVDRAFIENEIRSSSHYNPTDKVRIGRAYQGMTKIGPWTVPI